MLALVRRRGLALLMTSAVLVLAGCSEPPDTHASSGPSPGVVDPLTTITDSRDPAFVNSVVAPVVHESGRGASRYTFEVSQGRNVLRSYLACAPAGRFRVTIADKSYWGECDRRFTSTADIPVVTDAPRTETAKVAVSAGTSFTFLLIPTPGS